MLDARVRGIEERDGAYWQKTTLLTGQAALVQIQPPKEILEAEQLGNAKISNMMYRTLEYETQAPMRKVTSK